MARFRISYNAPVVLTFALIAVVVQLLPRDTMLEWFTSKGSLSSGMPAYVGLVTHIFGHADWNHLLANFMLILLVGPILEERYGSLSLLVMILITAVFSGLVGVVVGHASLGASGIVFMMILLASMANIRQREIPLTFIAIALMYVGVEVTRALTSDDNVSHLGHILGGLCGATFGFLAAKPKAPPAPALPAAKALTATTPAQRQLKP